MTNEAEAAEQAEHAEPGLRRWSAEEALAHGEPLKLLFADAYAEPPYHKGPAEAERFLVRLSEQAALPGFTFIASDVDTALAGHGLAGFAFGRHFGPGQWWYGAELMPPAELIEAEKFAVSELLVAPAFRGRRLSSRLLAELLRFRTEPYAILLSRPGSVARTIYHHWGWRPVGTARAAARWPASDALVKEMPGQGDA